MTSTVVVSVEFLLELALVSIVVLVSMVITGIQGFRQYRCNHDEGVNETRACQAICCKCGKNLGFIGAWREKEQEKP